MEWARKLLLAFQSKSNAEGLFPDNWTDRQKREEAYLFPTRPELATAMYKAFEITQDPRWRDDATVSGSVRPIVPLTARRWETIVCSGGSRSYEAGWQDISSPAGRPISRWQCRRARLLDRGQPHAQMASTLAESTSMHFVHLYQVTGEQRWPMEPESSATSPSGLRPCQRADSRHRRVDRPDYYDAIQGSGALALALYRLGEVKESATPVAPIRPQGEVAPPGDF